MCREKGPDDKGKQKKKVKEKKTTKLKTKDGEDDSGGWTEVKGSSSSAVVCNPLFASCALITIIACTLFGIALVLQSNLQACGHLKYVQYNCMNESVIKDLRCE